MASTDRVSTRANKGNQGLVQRSNVVVVLLEPSPVIQAISPTFVPKKKTGRRSQILRSKAVRSLDTVAYQAVGVDACVLDFVQPLGPDTIVCNPVAPDSIVPSLAFDIVGWQTLFGSNWSLLPQSPSPDNILIVCLKVQFPLAFLCCTV